MPREVSAAVAADPRFEKNAALVCAHTGFDAWRLIDRTDHVAGDQARIPEMTLKIAAERFKTIQTQERTQHDPLWGIRTSGLLSMRQVPCVASTCRPNGPVQRMNKVVARAGTHGFNTRAVNPDEKYTGDLHLHAHPCRPSSSCADACLQFVLRFRPPMLRLPML